MNIKRFVLLLISALVLVACNSKEETNNGIEEPSNKVEATESEVESKEETNKGATREITYLGETYTVPGHVERLVITGAMEAMEDAIALGVEPVGAITIAGEFPAVFKEAMGQAESIGEKQQPNFEKILQLKPDVILGTTKFPEEVVSKLEQIAPTILVSHISSSWEENILLMAELSGKQDEAEALLKDYNQRIENAKTSLTEHFEGKSVVAVRLRGGKMFVYPENVFFNPVLYDELKLDVPDAIQKAKAQEEISIEQLAEMNPDYIFIQVQQTPTGENEQAFDQLKENPIVKNINAFKENQVYVNIVDSLLEGGTVFSKNEFVKALQQK